MNYQSKTVINFCPTGMVPTKANSPLVPISPSEVIESTHEAAEIGITIAHLHARDINEQPSWKPDIYAKIVEGIRSYCPDLVICLSTSGRNFPEFEKRSAVIELKPDMCSLTLSSLNFLQGTSVNTPDMILKLLEKMNDYGVKPELECFDLGMINFGKYILNKTGMQSRNYWNLIFGNIAGWQPDLQSMGAAVSQLPQDDIISFGGLGKNQTATIGAAAALGYGIRIGLEDNLWLNRRRSTLASNQDLVRRTHQFLDMHEREYMTASEFGDLGFYHADRAV